MTQSVYNVIEIPKYIGWPMVALAGCGAFWWAAQRAAYYPFRYPDGAWQLKDRIGAEDVWITAADGIRLHAWRVHHPGARIVLLYLHGNGGNITHRSFKIAEMQRAGGGVLALDYRGYGRSDGSPSETGLYADAEAAYAYLVAQGYTGKQIVLYGESLGTSVAVYLAARRQVAGVILESPFTSGSEMAGRALPWIGRLVFRGYDTMSCIGKVSAPLLFIHGERDEVVPFTMGRRLFEAAPQPKQFWAIADANHNDIQEAAGDAFAERLRQFYSSL